MPRSASLDVRSAAYVGELLRQRNQFGATVATNRFSTTVYTVPATEPRVGVNLSAGAPLLQEAFTDVPIPAGAQPGAGGDQNLVVWQPARDTLWEFWHFSSRADGRHAQWGGRMNHVSTSPGYYRDLQTCPGRFTERSSWGAPASSLAKLGGLMTMEELQTGRIGHALAFAIPQPRAGFWAWPAQRTDGNLAGSTAIPEGTRFRLDPKLNIAALGLPRMTRMMAEAVQRYGMILNNVAGSIAFYAQDPTPTGRNPYPAIFQQIPPSQLLARFPWNRLQALKTSPNVSLSLTDGYVSVRRGQRLSYELRVQNESPEAVRGITVGVDPSDALVLTKSGSRRASMRLTWRVLAPRQAVTARLDMRVAPGASGSRPRLRARLLRPRDANPRDDVGVDANKLVRGGHAPVPAC